MGKKSSHSSPSPRKKKVRKEPSPSVVVATTTTTTTTPLPPLPPLPLPLPPPLPPLPPSSSTKGPPPAPPPSDSSDAERSRGPQSSLTSPSMSPHDALSTSSKKNKKNKKKKRNVVVEEDNNNHGDGDGDGNGNGDNNDDDNNDDDNNDDYEGDIVTTLNDVGDDDDEVESGRDHSAIESRSGASATTTTNTTNAMVPRRSGGGAGGGGGGKTPSSSTSLSSSAPPLMTMRRTKSCDGDIFDVGDDDVGDDVNPPPLRGADHRDDDGKDIVEKGIAAAVRARGGRLRSQRRRPLLPPGGYSFHDKEKKPGDAPPSINGDYHLSKSTRGRLEGNNSRNRPGAQSVPGLPSTTEGSPSPSSSSSSDNRDESNHHRHLHPNERRRGRDPRRPPPCPHPRLNDDHLESLSPPPRLLTPTSSRKTVKQASQRRRGSLESSGVGAVAYFEAPPTPTTTTTTTTRTTTTTTRRVGGDGDAEPTTTTTTTTTTSTVLGDPPPIDALEGGGGGGSGEMTARVVPEAYVVLEEDDDHDDDHASLGKDPLGRSAGSRGRRRRRREEKKALGGGIDDIDDDDEESALRDIPPEAEAIVVVARRWSWGSKRVGSFSSELSSKRKKRCVILVLILAAIIVGGVAVGTVFIVKGNDNGDGASTPPSFPTTAPSASDAVSAAPSTTGALPPSLTPPPPSANKTTAAPTAATTSKPTITPTTASPTTSEPTTASPTTASPTAGDYADEDYDYNGTDRWIRVDVVSGGGPPIMTMTESADDTLRGDSQDELGNSMAISGDGRTVAIGSRVSSEAGFHAGYVRVYRISGSASAVAAAAPTPTTAMGDEIIEAEQDAKDEERGGTAEVIPVPEGRNQNQLEDEGDNVGDHGGGGGSRDGRQNHDDGIMLRPLGSPLFGANSGDFLGESLALSRDGLRLAAGAGWSNPAMAGSVWVYEYDGFDWQPMGNGGGGGEGGGPSIEGTAVNEFFGRTLALSADGSIVAVGAPLSDVAGNDAGVVRVFRWVEQEKRKEEEEEEDNDNDESRVVGNWIQMGQELLGSLPGDEFGSDLALTADGLTLAVSANQISSGGVGRVEIVTWNGTHWTPLGVRQELTLAGSTTREGFGASLSFSADGRILAVGAPWYDDAGAGFDDGADRTTTAPPPKTPTAPRQQGAGETDAGETGTATTTEDAGRVRFMGLSSQTGEWRDIAPPLVGRGYRDLLGFSVDLSDDGRTCIVGIPGKDPSSNRTGCCYGQVLVYESTATNHGATNNTNSSRINETTRLEWVQKGQWTGGSKSGDNFGRNVAISNDGNVFMAAAPFNDANGENGGEVRVYRQEESGGATSPMIWEEYGQTLAGSAANDWFGWTISLTSDGTQLAVGCAFADVSGENSGYVESFQFTAANNTWVSKGARLSSPLEGDTFGYGVGLSDDGSTLIVGVPSSDVAGQNAGEAIHYAFSNNASNWSESTRFNGTFPKEQLGTDVGISNDGLIFAVGAMLNSNSSFQAGSVDVYQRATPTSPWEPMGSPIYGREGGEKFASAMALSGDGKTVAAEAVNDTTKEGFARVRVHSYNGTDWEQVGQDLNGFEVETVVWRLKIALNQDGTILAIGSYVFKTDNPTKAGTVHVYRLSRDRSEWIQIGDALYGYSVQLSHDGLTLAVGAIFFDNPAREGVDHGLVRVLHWDGLNWRPVGMDLVGEQENDLFGWSVALSGNGSIVAGGALFASDDSDGGGSGGANNTGIVRLYRRRTMGEGKADDR